MSTTWFTSDLHFGHEKVAVEHRGFVSVEAHDATLIAQWRAVVHPKDTVYVLGDLALGSPGVALATIGLLPGTKHLIAGNHDACHPMHRRWRTFISKYAQVFATVQPFGTVRVAGQQVLLSHFPYADDHTPTPRYGQWRLRDEGGWLVHGHTHDPFQRVHGREIHVGVDAWGFEPVGLKTIEDSIQWS